MKRIRQLNVIFDNDDHHDSHEFLIWLLNQINEEIAADSKDSSKTISNGNKDSKKVD